MSMTRRDFLKSALTLAALAPTARLSTLAARADDAPAAPDAAAGAAQGVTRRPFRDTGVTIPLLGFGLMRLPKKGDGLDYEYIDQMIDRALAAGVNYFDTAYFYIGGQSERCVGDLLSKRPRESYFLATKMPVGMVNSEADTERLFQEQLDRTKAGYFDFYLFHNIGWGDWQGKCRQHKIIEFLERKKSEGVIKHLGFSSHDSPENQRRIVKDYHWEFSQIQLNLQDWEEGPGRALYETLSEYNVPAIIMEPLRGGRLGSLGEEGDRILRNVKPDDSTASWAFRFVGSLPNVLVALSGMNRMDHLEENIRTFSPLVPLTEFEQRTLRTAYAASRNSISIPCTGCRYCVPCPVGVQIPEVFALANEYHRNHDLGAFQKSYEALAKEGGTAADCVGCGACLPKCPQHIEIPKELAKVAELAKKNA